MLAVRADGGVAARQAKGMAAIPYHARHIRRGAVDRPL